MPATPDGGWILDDSQFENPEVLTEEERQAFHARAAAYAAARAQRSEPSGIDDRKVERPRYLSDKALEELRNLVAQADAEPAEDPTSPSRSDDAVPEEPDTQDDGQR